MSDRSLRRLAWAPWWLLVAVFLSGLPLLLVEQPSDPESWGGGKTVGDIAFGVVVLTFPLVGLLILRRQPRNTIGWLLQAIGLVWAVNGLAENYATYGMVVAPGKVPGPEVVAAFNEALWVPAIGLTGTFLFLLYPDGHLPSRRWRPVAWICAATIILGTVAILLSPGRMEESPIPQTQNPLAWQAGEPLLIGLMVLVLPLLPLGIVACAFALVRRFRSSRGVERLQLKWLASAGTVVALLYLLTLLTVLLVERTDAGHFAASWVQPLQITSILSFVLLPMAIGIAILRHGLYEIDLVISRTLVYLGLTITLAGVYLASVLSLQLLLKPVTNQSDLAVAGSTLAVAGLFGPVRRRFQQIVDRRFYRSRYDAVQTLEGFAGRLRHQVELDAVGSDLLGVVHECVQPAHVSLWVRP